MTGWLLFAVESGVAMLCGEKTRLFNVYMAAVDRHAATVSSLSGLDGTDFKKAVANAELARQDAHAASLALDYHREVHDC
jgi:hypothetical protein